MKKILIASLMALSLMALSMGVMAENIYVITADNVNVREKPATGKVVGKVGKCNSFSGGLYTDREGWAGITIPGLEGYISEKFVKEIPAVAFTRAMLGEYLGEHAAESTSYSMGTLEEKDGIILLHITDWTAPDEYGFRGHISHVYAGEPDIYGINFTHYLYPYRDDIPVRQQMTTDSYLGYTYKFTATGDGELRSYDRILTLQESAGIKSNPVTERDLFDLKGNVKQMAHARIFVKDESESEPEPQQPAADSEDDEYYYDYNFDPVLDFINVMLFSPEGFITEYLAMNPEDNSTIKHLVYNSDGNNIKIKAIEYPRQFSPEYRIDASDFGIGYDGNEMQLMDFYDSDTGKSFSEYRPMYCGDKIFHKSGEKLSEISRSAMTAPFVTEAENAVYVSITNKYDSSSEFPSTVIIGYDFGGEGITIEADVKVVETDSHGNWTKRLLLSDGKTICTEVREIAYY